MSNNDNNLDFDNLDKMLSEKFNLDNNNKEQNYKPTSKENKTSPLGEKEAANSFVFEEKELDNKLKSNTRLKKGNLVFKQEVKKEVNSKKKKRCFFVVIPLLIGIALLGGVFAWIYVEQGEVNKHLNLRLENAQKEIDSLIINLDIFSRQNKNLITENDSLKSVLKNMDNQVSILLQKIKNLSYIASKSNEYKIKAQDVESLKAKYESQIAELKAKYRAVISENEDLKKQLQACRVDKKGLKEEAEEVKSKAKSLKGTAFMRTYDKKGRGTKDLKKVRKLKICVTVVANSFLKSGSKQLYVAFFPPKAQKPYKSSGNSITINGKEVKYTKMLDLGFDKDKNVQKCVDIKFPKRKRDKEKEKLYVGTYKIIVYSEEGEFSTSSILLK